MKMTPRRRTSCSLHRREDHFLDIFEHCNSVHGYQSTQSNHYRYMLTVLQLTRVHEDIPIRGVRVRVLCIQRNVIYMSRKVNYVSYSTLKLRTQEDGEESIKKANIKFRELL